MNEATVRKWIEANGVETFSRSSGPGGQNVNKVSTKALLRVSVPALEGISDEERARLLVKLGTKLTSDGDLIVQVQDERSQLLNRELAVERVIRVLEAALHRPKPRRKTKPTKASKERRLSAKKAASETLRNRRVGDE